MDTWHLLLLALLQGLTEFLPISSSAHLILLPQAAGWSDQGLAFDVAVHVGTLAAVVTYFRRELGNMGRDWGRSLTTGRHTPDSRLAWAVLIGTVPVGLAGLLFKDAVETGLRSPTVIAWATIGFGLLLWWADRTGRRRRDEHSLRITDILLIGAAQALALIPGTSRSGITITAGLMVGLSRQAAARFSFLLSIPVIALAGSLEVIEVTRGDTDISWQPLLAGAVTAGLAAYLCIHFFLRLLDRIGLVPFVVYRVLLGVVLLAVFR